MEELRKENLTWFLSFSQSSLRLKSDQMLFDSIMLSKVAHMNQPELQQHVLNAGVTYDNSERKKRIVKIVDSKKIDLLVALSMCNFHANRLNL
jgi:hypothetical protein